MLSIMCAADNNRLKDRSLKFKFCPDISVSLSLIQMSGVGGHTGQDQLCKWRRSKKRDADEPYE